MNLLVWAFAICSTPYNKCKKHILHNQLIKKLWLIEMHVHVPYTMQNAFKVRYAKPTKQRVWVLAVDILWYTNVYFFTSSAGLVQRASTPSDTEVGCFVASWESRPTFAGTDWLRIAVLLEELLLAVLPEEFGTYHPFAFLSSSLFSSKSLTFKIYLPSSF